MMADIEFSDGSTMDFPKKEGESLANYVQRMGDEADAEYQQFTERMKQSGLNWPGL